MLRGWLAAGYRKLTPRPDPVPALRDENRALKRMVENRQDFEAQQAKRAREFITEMVEAQAMCGSGPWAPGDPDALARMSKPLREALNLKEAGPVSTVGVYGMYELMLQNIGWQQEINYSWLEFTRWGIQQIILICRLYRLKNPIVRRLVDVCAQYVFARGVAVTTQDEDANKVWKAFVARNQKVLGHVALTELEKAKDSDGNLFFCFFSDAESTGETDIRMIDATEIQDIWTDPEDADVPWYYRRDWTSVTHDPNSGTASTKSQHAWYPALGYDPKEPPKEINGVKVMWGSPVYHRKVGYVGKWLFGCPRIYPMLDWAKEARRFLEACASVRQSLSQIAIDVKTRGGQQAIEGGKQQTETTLGPGMPGWDVNPQAVAGATFFHGPGMEREAFKVQGATFDPSDVSWYAKMCCMVKGVPPTFIGEMDTSNLATATSLDRPTETVFLNLQEEWTEDLTIIATTVLTSSLRAPNGKLREAFEKRGLKVGNIEVREAKRILTSNGTWKYAERAKEVTTALEIEVDFPSIREGDAVAETSAIVAAMTLNNKGGQVVGIDEKEGVKLLYRSRGVENGDELAEAQYPDGEYDPDRTVEELPDPVGPIKDQPGVQPTPGQVKQVVKGAQKNKESLKNAAKRLLRAIRLFEARGEEEGDE